MSRAFHNLRVNPADTIKFGIKWKGAFFLDIAAAFGWVHGSFSFQLIADKVMYIIEHHGFKAFAYVYDFVLVTEKNAAQQAFHTLSSLFQDLGLPMNEVKRAPPDRQAHMLGYHH